MARLLPRRIRRVLLDVDTQYDLLNHTDQDRSAILSRIRRLIAWARVRHIPVISTALSRPGPENCVIPSGSPTECIEGTAGQRKIRYTLLPRHICFGPENRLDLPGNLLNEYQQVIFEKRAEDPFTHPRADRMLTELKRDEFIVFGMGLETAVKATVLGLLYRGKKVLVVSDVVNGCDVRRIKLSLRQMEAKGAKLITTEALTGRSHLLGTTRLRKPMDGVVRHLNS